MYKTVSWPFLSQTSEEIAGIFIPPFGWAHLCDALSTFTAQNTAIHQVTTMLTTSNHALFPAHNHLLITGMDETTLWLLPERQHASHF